MGFEDLYVQESDEGDYLVIKPVPGQVIAQVDPGPQQAEYAKLFAAAPDLLRSLRRCDEFFRANDDFTEPICGDYPVPEFIQELRKVLTGVLND